jgi:hypothetical protein
MTTPVLTFSSFAPGTLMGRAEMLLDAAAFQQWFELFPEDEQGTVMPAGMVAVVTMRAYSEVVAPRPPGNVHGAQRFEIERLPLLGDRLVTEFRCVDKKLRGERKWVTFGSTTTGPAGKRFFTGRMTILWAA